MTRNQIISILVLFLTIFLTRFISLDKVPPHLSNDEISIAYDAYSVGLNLRDEYGSFLPLSFRSHNTYKAPLTTYLSVPFIKLFGNNDYAARLPSVIFGSLSVIVIGLLAFQLTKNINIGILASFILCLSPAHIHASRMIQETNIALFFVLLGSYLVLLAKEKQTLWRLYLALISFALSMYAYHTEWGFTPIWMICLLLLYFKDLSKRRLLLLFLFFGILISPLAVNYLNNLSTGARANTELITKDPGIAVIMENTKINNYAKFGFLISKVVQNYSNYTNIKHLFFTGMNLLPPEDPYQIGLFLSPLLVVFLIGAWISKKYVINNSNVLLWLLFLAPIIPACTFGEVSNYRILIIVFPITIITAIGLWFFYVSPKINRYFKVLYGALVAISVIYFLPLYYFHFPLQNGENYQYGYKQIALYLKDDYDLYKKIFIDPRFGESLIFSGVPRLYLPYYLKLDPTLLQNRNEEGESTNIGKISITKIDWSKIENSKDFIYISPTNNKPDTNEFKLVKEILLPNNRSEFRIYKYFPN